MTGSSAPRAFMEVEGLARVYTMGGGALRALDGVDVAIAKGEFVAVMGPSGSGKSTLMNLLGLLDQPTAGRYRLDGEDVAGLDPDARAALRNRKLGFVFQSFNLLARASALDNVALPLVYAGIGRRERRRRAADALARLGLGARMEHLPAELSGGQQQRVAIARALLSKPTVIFADEPTGNLDSQTSIEILDLLRAAVDEYGQTIVMVTHDTRAASIADRTLFLADGSIVKELAGGSARDIIAVMEELSAR